MSILFTPIKLGSIELKNRIAMSSLTRSRAFNNRVPNDLAPLYYSQRATAGLILSEATDISKGAAGYIDTPGMYTKEQIEGWKKVTDAVHAKGGKIVSQLWHVGRMNYLDADDVESVSASAIKPNIPVAPNVPSKFTIRQTPRALETHEVKQIVADFKQAAINAKEAGFDGVEAHCGNGYLIDQFLQDSTNKRTDEYGGSLENRLRFALEVVDAFISVWGADKVGVNITSTCDVFDMGDSNPLETFGTFAEELSKRKVAFLFINSSKMGEGSIVPQLKQKFNGAVILNNGFNKELAEQEIEKGNGDLVAFGRLYIENPDLVERFQNNYPLAKNPEANKSYYGGDEKGYTDYPTYK